MLTQFAKSAVFKLGLTPNRAVSIEQMRGLLARLQPQQSRFPLIRIGGEGDGGYLVPDDLDGIAACFSPGVDVTASFEADMLARGVPCFLADASVKAPPISHPAIDFIPRYLGAVTDAQTITLDHWVTEKAPSEAAGDLLLQMDIEGHEWIVLLNASDHVLSRMRIMALELHGFPNCLDPLAWQLVNATLDRLGRMFHVVHAHVNADRPPLRAGGIEIPYLLEVTLLRKDRSDTSGAVTQFPHPLDRSNVLGQPDYLLPECLQG